MRFYTTKEVVGKMDKNMRKNIWTIPWIQARESSENLSVKSKAQTEAKSDVSWSGKADMNRNEIKSINSIMNES